MLKHLPQVWRSLAIVLALIPSVAVCQTGNLSVSGNVRDELTREPIAGAQVELKAASAGKGDGSAISGRVGDFQFNGLASGSYVISVEREGYQSIQLEIGLAGSSQSPIVVSLRRLDTNVPHAPGNSVSVHELSRPAKAREAYDKGVELLTSANPDYDRALAHLQRAVKECPTYYEAFAEMGIAEFQLGNSAGAEKSLRKSLELSGNQYPKALFLLADLLNRLGRFADAEPIAAQMIASEPSSSQGAQGHYELARALDGQRRASEAEANATKALEMQPDDPKISLLLGNIHIQERNYAAAIRDFDRYLRVAPQGPQSDLVRKGRERIQKALYAEEARTQKPSLP